MEMDAIGLHGAILIAGFSGGVCYVALQPGRPSIWGACSGLAVATLTANYLSVLAVNYFGSHAAGSTGTVDGAAAFIVGLCGPWICRAIIRKVRWGTNGDHK